MGGVEVYTQGIAKALIARGHALAVFVREDDAQHTPPLGLRAENYEGVPIHRFFAPPRSEVTRWLATFGDTATLAAFQDVLDKFQPEVVHFQHLLGLPVGLVDEVRQRRIPQLLTLHDYWFICANTKLLTNDTEQTCLGPQAWVNCGQCALAKLGVNWAWPLAPMLAPIFAARDWRLQSVLQQFDALIAPTDFVRDTFVQHGAPAQRVQVIDYGIELPPMSAPPLSADGPLRVAYVGAVARLKGVQVLVEAFNALPPDAELRIAGDLARQPDYVRVLHQNTQHPGVRYLGPQNRAEVWGLLRWADVVAVPSLWYEVSPLVIHEAFAMRRPVIASHIGSLASRVRDGVDGRLLPPGDVLAWSEALNELASQRARLLRFQEAIRPARTVTHHAQELEQLYRQSLSSKVRAKL